MQKLFVCYVVWIIYKREYITASIILDGNKISLDIYGVINDVYIEIFPAPFLKNILHL